MGSGGVGGYFGAVLSRSGHDVTFIARGDHLKSILKNGLRIESITSGNFNIDANAVDKPAKSYQADLILYCVKGYDNAQAIDIIQTAVGDQTLILTLQNGIGSGEILSSRFGASQILLGVTYMDSLRKDPGVIAELGGRCNILFGEENGNQSNKSREVLRAFQKAKIDVQLSSDILKELWNKLIYISALSGMTCVTRSTFDEILAVPLTLETTLELMRETESVARAKGIKLENDIVDTAMSYFNDNRKTLFSSMYADLERGNRLEVEVLNGAVARIGDDLGVPTPVNSFITACLMPSHIRASN